MCQFVVPCLLLCLLEACIPPLACEVRPSTYFASFLQLCPRKRNNFHKSLWPLTRALHHHTHRPHHLPAPCACLHILDGGVRRRPNTHSAVHLCCSLALPTGSHLPGSDRSRGPSFDFRCLV
ncbi:hypothetical protein IWX91DRAFT_198097 [Phyllosticta citricarpa]